MNVIESINRDALKMAAGKLVFFRKMAAIHSIKMQPFYGKYYAGMKCNDTLKIRRPKRTFK